MDHSLPRNEEDDIRLEEAVGATAVNAAEIEQNILRQVENAAGNETVNELEAKQQQLWAVRRELRAVRSTLTQMEQPPEEAENEGEDAGPKSLAHGELQLAVMRERLVGLEREAAQLERSLAQYGAAPAPQVTEENVQEVLLKNKKGKKGGKKGAGVRFELQEADLFDAAEAAAAATQGRGASLVETERDRLIRLVRLFHTYSFVLEEYGCASGSLMKHTNIPILNYSRLFPFSFITGCPNSV